MATTDIEWTDRVWNPVRGCARVSPGCEHCYAERIAYRFGQKPGSPYEGLTVLGKHGPRWTGKARFVPEMLAAPLGWQKPQRIFVNSMSDLFHESVTDEQIAAVFGVMAACPQHTFQVLTKRPERMLQWFECNEDAHMQLAGAADAALSAQRGMTTALAAKLYGHFDDEMGDTDKPWPLSNVWLGTSTEDQQRADERIPLLLQCPAAIRFVSAEPLLGPIDFRQIRNTVGMAEGQDFIDALSGSCWTCSGPDYYDSTPADARLDWIIVGGESGHGARPCDVRWIRSIVDQCAETKVACFVKQLGARPYDVATGLDPAAHGVSSRLVEIKPRDRKGGDAEEWPAALRVRQFPNAAQHRRTR